MSKPSPTPDTDGDFSRRPVSERFEIGALKGIWIGILVGYPFGVWRIMGHLGGAHKSSRPQWQYIAFFVTAFGLYYGIKQVVVADTPPGVMREFMKMRAAPIVLAARKKQERSR